MAGVKTQGSQVWFRTGGVGTYALVRIPGVSSFTFNTQNGTKIDVTDLDSTAVESLAGLVDNGAFQLNINRLPWNNSNRDDQVTFLSQAQATVSHYVIGLSDGTDAPTIDATTAVITYDANRSWLHFDASYVGYSNQTNARDAFRVTATAEITGSITDVERTS